MLWWNLMLLKFADYRIRRRAIKALGKSRETRAQALLTEGLYDEHYLVRKEAARALGESGDAGAIKPLIRLSEESIHCAMARVAVQSLQDVLGRALADVTAEDLREAANLDDVSGFYRKPRVAMSYFTGIRQSIPWMVDCSRIRDLASRELIRRGLS